MKNKILVAVIIILIPFAVISFNKDKTNFNLPKNNLKEEKKIKLKDQNNSINELELEDYVIGVVAGEMPASFEPEALKAQAIASRTYAVFKMNQNKEYDVLATTSDQVYITKEQMQEKWGDEYPFYYEKIKDAVEKTKSLIITYNNEAIESFYFALSNGYTENSLAVFNEQQDYLISVESKDENTSKAIKTITISKEEFCNKLNVLCDSIVIKDIIRNASNRVETININNNIYTGVEIRKKLDLRSTDFNIEQQDSLIAITTNGYGHGVGMSQYGANAMAKEGKTYQEIISHYYQNTKINKL